MSIASRERLACILLFFCSAGVSSGGLFKLWKEDAGAAVYFSGMLSTCDAFWLVFSSFVWWEYFIAALPWPLVTKTNCLCKNVGFLPEPFVGGTVRPQAIIFARSDLFYGCITQSQQGSYSSASICDLWFRCWINIVISAGKRNSELLNSLVVPFSGNKTR